MKNLNKRNNENSNVNACNYCIVPLFKIENYNKLSDYTKNIDCKSNVYSDTSLEQEDLKINVDKENKKKAPKISYLSTFSRIKKMSKCTNDNNDNNDNNETKDTNLPKCRLIPLIVNKQNHFGKKSKSIFDYLQNFDTPKMGIGTNRNITRSKYDKTKSLSLDQEMNKELKEIGKIEKYHEDKMSFVKVISKNYEKVLNLGVILREKLGMNSTMAKENERYYKNQAMISKIKKKIIDLSIYDKWLNSTNIYQNNSFSNKYGFDNLNKLSEKLEKTYDSINLILNNNKQNINTKMKVEPKLKKIISKISNLRNLRKNFNGSRRISKDRIKLNQNSKINLQNISLDMKDHQILKLIGKKDLNKSFKK